MKRSSPFASPPRLTGLTASPTLAVNERSAALEAAGKTVYRFGLGQSPFPVPPPVVDALRANAHQKDYLPVRGLPALRQAVAGWLQRTTALQFDPELILIAPGSKELLFLIQMAVDGVLLLPSPSWVSYHPQARLAGNPVRWIDTLEQDDWLLQPDALRSACRENDLGGRTGILLLNTPNNPTGTSYSEHQLQALAEVARELGLLVISDEIYGAVHHDGQHVSIARYYPEGTLVTTGLSKWCGAGGWRLGVAAFPAPLSTLASNIAAMASETYTAASAPIQFAAVAAFQPDPAIDDYLDRSRRVLRFIRDYVSRGLRQHGITLPNATGAFYLFANFTAWREPLARLGIDTSDLLCEQLLQQTGIATLPGTVFGRPAGELTLRFSYVDFDGEQALRNAALITADLESTAALLCPKIRQAMGELGSWLETLADC